VPLIVEAMRALPAPATLDGEGVVLDDRGGTDFERLRSALARRGSSRFFRQSMTGVSRAQRTCFYLPSPRGWEDDGGGPR
jgi:ATP-dependent DNA ligase